MSQINILGPVGYNPTGNYDPTRTYEKLDVVYYQGSSYVAISDSLGQLPTNAEYWNCIAAGSLKQFTYNTVADMKADNTLSEGMYASTVVYYEANDGGAATYKITSEESETDYQEELENGLYATLIKKDRINVKQLGATNENLVTILNSLLTKNYPIYVPKERYTISSPILFNNDNCDIIIDGDLQINANISCISIKSSKNNIVINGTISSTDRTIGTGIEIGADTKSIGFNNIKINDINNINNGILVNPDSNYGVHYNKIVFNKITANYCIHFKAGNTSTPWVNENTFTGGRLSGGIGVYTEKGTNQTDPYNGNKFNCIGYEDIECGIELNFAKNNIFDECRMAENLTGNYWIYCHNDSYDNTFNIQQNIRVTTLRDDNNSMNTRNIYNPNAICDADWYRIGKSCYSAGGLFAIPDGECYDNDKLNIQHYNQNGAITNPSLFSSDAIISIGGDNANANYDVILPAGVFNIRKVKSFYVYVVYKEASSTTNIKTSDNTTLIDTSAFGDARISRKLYQVKYLPDRYAGYTWKLIHIDI